MSGLNHDGQADSSLSRLGRINQACDAFEADWRAGRRPRIEDFLGETSEPQCSELLRRLVEVELELRRTNGERPTPEEYRERFPEHPGVIHWVFEVDRACDAFEADWRAGRRPRVEDFLGETPEPERSELRRRLRELESELGRADGEKVADPEADSGASHAAPETPASPARSLPFILGEYELVRLIGAGGMGEVYEGCHRRLGKRVAVKLLPAGQQASQRLLERFRREIEIVGPLDDPHLVKAYHAGELGGDVYLVLEYVEGNDFKQLVTLKGHLPVAKACELVRQAALGLQYLHEQGLVHRDVKPANLMRTLDGQVKVLDLGLARRREKAEAGKELTELRQGVGTPDYLAPEQIDDAAGVDIRADVYGLGGTLYYLLTGRAPFARRQGLAAKLEAHALEEPPDVRSLRPEVPEGVAKLVARMLAKRPDDRPATPLEVADELARLNDPPATLIVDHVPAHGPGRRWSWRVSLAAAVLLGFVGVLLAVLGFRLVWPETSRGPEPPLTASLDVRIWKKQDTKRGLALNDPGGLPLRAGDWMRIEARLNRPAYVYLIYLDAEGKASPLFPWRDYSWDNHQQEKPLASLTLPENPLKDAAPLKAGPSGIEAVLLLAREEPLSEEESAALVRLFADAPGQGRFDPLRGAVWLDAEAERFGDERDRGRPNSDQAGQVEDPVQRMRRMLRGELRPFYQAGRAVCFPFQGE